MHLLSLQSLARFPLKMEIRLRQEEIHTVGHHLRMPFTFRTGTSFVYICLSLIASDAHLSRCITYLCPFHILWHVSMWFVSHERPHQD